MIVVTVVMALLNWTIGGLYVSDGRWGFAAAWIVAGCLWLIAAHFAVQTRRYDRETDRILRGIR